MLVNNPERFLSKAKTLMLVRPPGLTIHQAKTLMIVLLILRLRMRAADIMNFVTEVYKPDDSKMFMRGDRQFVLPPWAIDRNTAKCAFCERRHEMGWPEEDEERLSCSKCGGTLLIAEIATATSNIPWTAEDLDMVKHVMRTNRECHDLQVHEAIKKEAKEKAGKKPEQSGKKPEPKGKKQETYIHQCFGHDQDAIEGFKDCDEELQKALDHGRVERNAATYRI